MLHPFIAYYLVGITWFCYLMINEHNTSTVVKEIEMKSFKKTN